MAMSLLGTSIDVHGGGKDLAFPHHAYESAQSELLTGVAPFARAWMHVGTVFYEGEKMSKSLGNLVYVADLVERWDPAAIRLLLIDRPWYEDWAYEEGLLTAASDRLERLWSQAGKASSSDSAFEAAITALENDLDVPAALDIAEDAGGAPLRRLGGLLGLL